MDKKGFRYYIQRLKFYIQQDREMNESREKIRKNMNRVYPISIWQDFIEFMFCLMFGWWLFPLVAWCTKGDMER